MRTFEWTEPATLEEVAAALQKDGAFLKAGGVDLLELVKDGLLTPERLVSLGRVNALNIIERTDAGGLRVGARVTLAALADHPLVRADYRALAQAASHSATATVRAVATLGGNLLQRSRCPYFRSKDSSCLRRGGEVCSAQSGGNRYHAIFGNRICAMVHPSTPATALLALRAVVVLRCPEGTYRRVPLEDFFVPPSRSLERETVTQPGEILTCIELPPVAEESRSWHVKESCGEGFYWPTADVAVSFRLVEGRVRAPRVVLGAAAPAPLRRQAAERILEGRSLDVQTADHAAKAALGGARPLEENAYKLLVFRSAIRRALLEAVHTDS